MLTWKQTWFPLPLRAPGRWALMLFSKQRETLTRGAGILIALQLFKSELYWTVCKSCNPHHSWNEQTSCNEGINIQIAEPARNSHHSVLFQGVIYFQPLHSFSSLLSGAKGPISNLHLLLWWFNEFLWNFPDWGQRLYPFFSCRPST